MKRSRLLQIGAPGSKRRNFCQTVYMTGASAIGVPGWPELAAWTASMQSVRMVSIASLSMGSLSRAGKSALAVWVMGSTFLGERPGAGSESAAGCIRNAIATDEMREGRQLVRAEASTQ